MNHGDAGIQHSSVEDLLLQVEGLLGLPYEGLDLRMASLANISALLAAWMKDVNWVGFYMKSRNSVTGEDCLVLGPFQGKIACTVLRLGSGVCGTACTTGRAQLVPDVHAFPGHIACDAESKSELVVPVFHGESVVAVLDIDSPLPSRFKPDDAAVMGKVAELVSRLWD